LLPLSANYPCSLCTRLMMDMGFTCGGNSSWVFKLMRSQVSVIGRLALQLHQEAVISYFADVEAFGKLIVEPPGQPVQCRFDSFQLVQQAVHSVIQLHHFVLYFTIFEACYACSL
jgi:hypothetical protein